MTEFKIVDLEEQTAAVVRGTLAIPDLPAFFAEAFHKVINAAGKAGVSVTGPPFGYYPEMPTNMVTLEAGFPTSGPVDDGDVHTLVLPGGKAIEGVHVGPFETMEQTYNELFSWTAEQGLEMGSAMWELYLTDPKASPDPATWETRIVWPLR